MTYHSVDSPFTNPKTSCIYAYVWAIKRRNVNFIIHSGSHKMT